ncbi:MAG: hypothetical protein WCG97_02700 [bacterium]
MREFQDRKNRKPKIYSLWVLFSLLVIVALFAKGVISVYEKAKSTKVDLKRLEAQKTDVENRYDTISKEASVLKTSDGVESAIREKFDVAKKGEGVIVVVDKTIEQPVQEKGFVQRVWDSVKGVFQ